MLDNIHWIYLDVPSRYYLPNWVASLDLFSGRSVTCSPSGSQLGILKSLESSASRFSVAKKKKDPQIMKGTNLSKIDWLKRLSLESNHLRTNRSDVRTLNFSSTLDRSRKGDSRKFCHRTFRNESTRNVSNIPMNFWIQMIHLNESFEKILRMTLKCPEIAKFLKN